MKIISLVPSQTELLYDLGLENQIFGQTKFCVHPKQKGANAQVIGGTKNVNIAKIMDINPDLIIGNKEENDKSQILELQKHFKTYISDIVSFEDALAMIETVGFLTNTTIKATELIQQIHQDFKKIAVESVKPKSVIYLIWNNPIMAAGQQTFINTMLEKFGFENIIKGERYPIITDQQLLEINPEILFLSSEPFPFKEKHVAYFRAILPNTQIKIVDGEMFSWYGSRLLKAVAYLLALRNQFD